LHFDAVTGQQYLVRVGKFPVDVDADGVPDEPGGAGVVRIRCGKEGCPGEGDCFSVGVGPGCENPECCEATCAVDSYCCEMEWDDTCVAEAEGLCTGGFAVCTAGSGACTDPNLQPGCDAADCCNAVCRVDPVCCLEGWDEICVQLESEMCFSACGEGSGDCFSANGTPGCENAACCAEVCPRDRFCCNVGFEWDDRCAERATQLCGGLQNCPIGELTWTAPPNGVVDARLPHAIINSEKIGIDTIKLNGPAGIDRACFALCETGVQGSANQIIDIAEIAGEGVTSVYTLTLGRPITTGAATTITYRAEDDSTSTLTMIAHPGNVNGDTIASAADVGSVLDVLRGVEPGLNAPWNVYSADADRTGVVAPPDILSVVDMLNGAAVLERWLNTPRPSANGICP
jgi:hypothetical protein